MTVYVYSRQLGKVVPKHEAPENVGPVVIEDLQTPFESPVDGSMITSRADLRRHNRQHGVEQVGNDLRNMPLRKHRSVDAEAVVRELGQRLSEAGLVR